MKNKEKKPFSVEGDKINQWQFVRKLTPEEKKQEFRKSNKRRREWVEARCLDCNKTYLRRADQIRSGASKRCDDCKKRKQHDEGLGRKAGDEYLKKGETFGNWRFAGYLSRAEKIKYCETSSGKRKKNPDKCYVRCTCLKCKTEQIQRSDIIKSGSSKQCVECYCAEIANPYAKPDHEHHSIYVRLIHIQRRCESKSCPAYKWYGKRGINVAEKYSTKIQKQKNGSSKYAVENLLKDMGLPQNNDFKKYTIGRIDNNKGYVEGNLRWETALEQARNKSNSFYVEMPDGEMLHINELAEILDIKVKTLKSRIKNGYTFSELKEELGGKIRNKMLEKKRKIDELIRSGRYAATTDGKVLSITKNRVTVIKPWRTSNGYLNVKLSYRAQPILVGVHRFVAQQYLVVQNHDELVVAHKNDQKRDNSIDNLAWCQFETNSQAIYSDVIYKQQKFNNISPFDVKEITKMFEDSCMK